MTIATLRVGKVAVRKALFPSEPGYTASVRSQMQEIVKELNSIFDQVEDASADICLEALRPTFAISQVYCPKRTGKLVNSGYLTITSRRGRPRVECGYAPGGDPPYAILVHERVEIPHRSPTRSKFLQAAMVEDLDNIRTRLFASYRFMFGVYS